MTDIGSDIKKQLHRLMYMTLVLYCAIIIVVVAVIIDSSSKSNALHKETVRVNKALCTFRDDLTRRTKLGQEFLAKHPNGVPGIPREAIEMSVRNQLQTVASLSGLNC